ncbi:Transposase type 1 [Trinorchestia longiramus]|nr:Transposase type 1 [Trinorchestia longiramus]
MLHEFKLGHNASEASANINRAWGEESTRDQTVRKWFGKFRSGDESLKDEEGRGRLGSLENEQLHAAVEQNPRQSKKIMVTVWWSAIGVIHYSFLGVNETINAERYCNDLAVMHARLSEKRPALVNRRGPILLHDNARPHVARMTVQKLTELGYETLPHPSFSPDLSPTDYHLFKHLSTFLDGKTFKSKQEVGGMSRSDQMYRLIEVQATPNFVIILDTLCDLIRSSFSIV